MLPLKFFLAQRIILIATATAIQKTVKLVPI